MIREKLESVLDKSFYFNVEASVLIPLNLKELKIVMIKRSEKVSRSSGHVAFPGGMREDNEDPVETALREAEEELGIKDVDVLGFLRAVRVRTYNIMVCPVVGVIDSLDFRKNFEVEEVLVDYLRRVLESRLVVDGKPFFKCSGKIVWGATARMLDDFYLRITRAFGSIRSFFG